MLFILLAPSWAWLVRRYGGRRWAQALLAFFAFLVYAVNFYVAFLSQGDVNQRGLLDWRKQMSAVTYLLSFMLSGALSCRVRRSAARGGASRLASPRFWGRALSVILLAALAITGALVWGRLPEALYDLSFKSTSLLAFALAFAALFWCALSGSVSSPSGRDRGQVRARARGFAPLAVSALASGILGFYIVQSLMYGLWDPFCARLLSRAIRTGSVALFLVLGLVFGLGFVLVATLFDRLVRKPLLAKLGL
ncbi:hypothetical protein BACT_1286 [Bifidobacterium actinocoloniiforme DSM 22766]|uniref:Acyltransferase 3 domain-containing protein n=2 Tax=Bifidobacterium actinocoloniiforme TaxID=638619 RepID=A0A086Z232_9BIFI|nr:hypothetical protein [Bifidobacterium actinocoloniiforme]KFI40582.1 hypothetical protein BACT_1286 [Bifidobacterium actinocoloniiforme DSM 22766]